MEPDIHVAELIQYLVMDDGGGLGDLIQPHGQVVGGVNAVRSTSGRDWSRSRSHNS